MPQSSELAGGEGFTFEGDVAAFYLSALLAEAYAPGINDRTVVKVSVQQRDFNEPLDDVIVDFESATNKPARLSLQVKRSLTISQAKTNKYFRDIIRDSWATLRKSEFRINADRYGVAVGTVSSAKERALKTLCDWARESLTTDHFDTRFTKDGNSSEEHKVVKSDVVALLEEAKGAQCTSEEVHQFFAHFVIIQFDFLLEGATDSPEAINHIRNCLVPDDVAKAPLVWSKAVQLVRASAGKSGQFDRARLVRLVSPVARLTGAISLRSDLDKLMELAKSYASLIPDDIGGIKLDRTSLLENLNAKLVTARVIQVRGLPGSGKSVVVRRAVQDALERGPTLFLKAEQLNGTSWINYATLHGLSAAPLEQVLVEIGAAGTPILFIDAIDRIGKEQQSIIIDVIRTIVESPLLDNWRFIVSLRDTGIEVLRNWLGYFLDILKVETLNINQLSDEEAETLAKAKPHLRSLLFGSHQVKEIVRRPFFAKVLNQSYVADPSIETFAPQSEVDLIENWWQRGGYNESGQSAIERQRALLDLARIRAGQLNQPIGLGQLTSVAHIDGLKSDGILQNAREGVSVLFAHDIFFEWSFFHVLADCGPQWIEMIKGCGEPPAVARVVELTSQWEYVHGTDWAMYLAQTEASDLRSQWLRAWLIGPSGTAWFDIDDEQFAKAVFADDFRLFRKALVWFQAEKTSPNANVLAGVLPQEQRQWVADLLGWPSDVAAWCRLIDFILRHISTIPQRLYPEVVAIFEVWQNAFADIRNPTSRFLLQQCAIWLASIDAISDEPDENYAFWHKMSGLGAFRKSLGQLLLKSSRTEPTFAADYLQRVINSERIRDDAFNDIITYSYILAQSQPQLVVDLSLAFLHKELPDEQVERERKELHDESEWRKAVLAKPESERSRQEKRILKSSGAYFRTVGDFSYHDWERLSIHDDHRSFNPPSPLREPFYSLFQSSPDEALRLLRELCNHAMTAWRQLHRHSRHSGGTPIPLELTFSWGSQRFWGTDREYLWYRSMWGADSIGCGFMALEEWCFSELARGRSPDELIRQVIEGNECIAILGIASVVALHTETVSETTLPLFTSQRLLTADRNRMVQDFSSAASLIGFHPPDTSHIEAIKAANARPIRKTQLSWMVARLIFTMNPLCDKARETILNFKNDLPFQYEEHRELQEVRESLTAQALEYAELATLENYQAYRTREDSDQIEIVHVSPSAAEPEKMARAEKATKYLTQTSLWPWASKSFEENALSDTYTVEDAIELAREADKEDLFDPSSEESEGEGLSMCRGAIAATAAIVLNFRAECTQEDINWARGILCRAIRLPEKTGRMWSPVSVIPWHQNIYVAYGLAADLREGTAACGAARDLLGLIAHPLEIVSLSAFEEACKLWVKDPRLSWAALVLALSLCHVPPRSRDQLGQHNEALHHSSGETQAAVDAVITFYETGSGWPSLPLPPSAWVKIEPGRGQRKHQNHGEYNADDVVDTAEVWAEPDVFWHSKQAANILERIPFDEILGSSAKSSLLDFISGVLNWTNQKNAPPWVKPGRRDRSDTSIYEWTHTLGSRLGHMAGLMPLRDFRVCFLDPILGLEDDNCWALLSPFVNTYICAYVFDAIVVTADAVATLDLCLDRFLQAPAFKRDAYRSGKFSGFDQPRLISTLMFVSVEHANLATRYVNGDWSEISHILPLINRFIRTGGWLAVVMDPFLTLCERAKVNYPSEDFADQILSIIADGPDSLTDWHGTYIPANIAGLVQHFAHRDTPMALTLAQKFLRILDILIDMGDRRSAALQLGEAFREIRLD